VKEVPFDTNESTAGSVEDIIIPMGRSMTNEDIKPWRSATGKILSQGAVMSRELPLIVAEFSAAIRKCVLAIHKAFEFVPLCTEYNMTDRDGAAMPYPKISFHYSFVATFLLELLPFFLPFSLYLLYNWTEERGHTLELESDFVPSENVVLKPKQACLPRHHPH
jgi:hypothetical protein